MRTLILSFVFIAVFLTAKANELPLLNLEVGKTYCIETTLHIDVSANWPRRIFDKKEWELKPISYDESKHEYKLEARLIFYKYAHQEKSIEQGWQEIRSFETGFHSPIKLPLYLLNKLQLPVIITINDKGEISEFDYSKCVEDDKPILQLENKVFVNKFENEFQRIFRLAPDKYEVLQAENEPEEDSKFQLTVKDLSQDANGHSTIVLDTITGLKFREYHRFLVSETDTYGYLKKNGAKNRGIYFQKYIPVYESPNKVYDDYKHKQSDTINTVLRVILPERIANYDSVIISIGDNIVKAAIDSTNQFEIGLNLKSHHELYFEYPICSVNNMPARKNRYFISKYPNNFLKEIFQSDNEPIYAAKIVVSPGDDLKIKYELNTGNQYVMKSISGLGKNEILLNSKDIDPTIELHKRFEMEYSKCLRHNLYKNDLTLGLEKRILVNNSLATSTRTYMNFLERYIATVLPAQISEKSGINFNDISSEEFKYLLGNIALHEPVRSYFFSWVLKEMIWQRPNYTIEDFSLYQLNKNEFNNTPLFDDVKYVSENIKKLKVGDVAPEINLYDFEGEMHRLEDFKGQVVVVSFFQFSRLEGRFYADIYYKNYIQIYKDNNVVCLNIFYGDKNLCSQKAKEYNMDFILFDDAYPNSSIYENYQLSKPNNKFLIDRNGRIVSISEGFNYFYINEINKALAIPYESENELPVWLRITFIALIGALFAIAITFIFYRSITKRRLQKSELNKKMRELELTAIRAQMNPHFMYNCLNSIQNLVQKQQNDEAHLYLSKFASLIRRTLNTSKKEEIALAEELETIQEYIELEKLRFDFEYTLNVDHEIEVNSVFVPPMLLQPFVENALLHGLLPKSSPRKLLINVYPQKTKICIDIEDNGIGRSTAVTNGTNGNGKGLQLSKERLDLLEQKYKTSYRFKIVDLVDENGLPLGTRVSLCFQDE